jgi:hypothetical protein
MHQLDSVEGCLELACRTKLSPQVFDKLIVAFDQRQSIVGRHIAHDFSRNGTGAWSDFEDSTRFAAGGVDSISDEVSECTR